MPCKPRQWVSVHTPPHAQHSTGSAQQTLASTNDSLTPVCASAACFCVHTAHKENIVNGGSDLKDLLAKADALHSKAERPREHAVDAEVFAQLAQCGLAMIKNCGAINNVSV